MVIRKWQMWSRWTAGICLALAAAGVCYEQSIKYARERESLALRQRIGEARRVVEETQALEVQASREQNELRAIQGNFPPTSALVWFPQRVTQHFGVIRGTQTATRLNTALDEVGLPGFERTYWAVEMPVGMTSEEIREICIAIAEFERLESAVRVLDVTIRPDADDPTRRLMIMNVAVLAPKRTRS
jgi:hypothetical protein